MNHTVALQCHCGSLKGELKVHRASSFHVHCLCCDCQNFAKKMGCSDKILDRFGATELLQTYPAYLSFSHGAEHLRCAQLSPKGLYRWHTNCCNMPVANTMHGAKVPFVGVSVKLMQFEHEQEKQAILGPVVLKAFAKYAKNGRPDNAHDRFPLTFLPKIMGFMAKGWITKKHAPHPLFNDGTPLAKPMLLPR